MQLLLDRGAKLDIATKGRVCEKSLAPPLLRLDGEEVIHVAARCGNRTIVECLLDTRISIEDKDFKGDHPIEVRP